MKSIVFPITVAASLVASPALAQESGRLVQASPAQIGAIFTDLGLQWELKEDGVGDPMLEVRQGEDTDAMTFQVYFYGCNADGSLCETMQYKSWFETDTPLTYEKINGWNAENRFGRVYLDEEQDVAVAMDLDLEDGGMPRALFVDNYEYFDALLWKVHDFAFGVTRDAEGNLVDS